MDKNFENRIAEIMATDPEDPTEADLLAIRAAEKEDPDDAVSLEEYILQKEYSGKLMIRIPKSLHKELALAAKENGVSLNQYALYKLAK